MCHDIRPTRSSRYHKAKKCNMLASEHTGVPVAASTEQALLNCRHGFHSIAWFATQHSSSLYLYSMHRICRVSGV